MLDEKRKGIFLELAYQLALIDNDFSEKERSMIESYCNEMQIIVPEVIHARPVNEIIADLEKECAMLEKKIMLFEILGLALVDGNYDEAERTIVADIRKVFEIEESFVKESEEILKDYIEMQNRMNALVVG